LRSLLQRSLHVLTSSQQRSHTWGRGRRGRHGVREKGQGWG
jgi:hypothetical protein